MVATVCLQLTQLCDCDSPQTTREVACQPCERRNDCSGYYRDIKFIWRRRVAPDISLCEYFVDEDARHHAAPTPSPIQARKHAFNTVLRNSSAARWRPEN